MSKIEKINLNEIVDYSDNEIDYFIEEGSNSDLVNYGELIKKIYNAKKTIQISSTSIISNEIIDALYQNNEINIYILLKSFDNANNTLGRFGEKKPAVIREVKELENNFVIIDDISYFFINTLENKENIFIKLDENKTKDLSYIFNYYFWDCASQEKLVDVIAKPIESPFPPIGIRVLDYINTITTEFGNCTKLFIPRDKRFISELNKNCDKKYFSDEIENCVYQSNDNLQIGKLVFKDETFSLQNRWLLKNSSLKDISIEDQIIPKQNNWDGAINIEESKYIQLSQIEAKTIEEMIDTKPNEFKQELYIKNIIYNWDVLPPLKVKESKKSSLYNEYDKLNSNFQEQLSVLESNLIDLEKESGLLSFFSGANRKAKQNLKKIAEYKSKDLKDFNHIDLDNLLNKEFKCFYENIFSSSKNFKEDKKRQEAKNKWEEQKEQKTKSLKSKEEELIKIKEELKSLRDKSEEKKILNGKIKEFETNIIQLKKEKKEYKNEIVNLENLKKDLSKIDDKQKEQTKLNKNIKSIESTIDILQKAINENYLEFTYNPKQNEIKNFNKNKTNSNEYKKLDIPKYILPEVGILFETKENYYLEILDKKDLKKANELSQRYSDKKNYKVVAGGF